jgi:tetratricopeptide (TPR) repeat protein
MTMSTWFQKFFPLICLLFAACSLVPNELKIAEQLMESKPDSALKILQNIKSQNLKSDSNRALYGLLLFQALDNNSMPLQPDSLLDFSITYYLKENNQPRLADCYFYKGRKFKSISKYEDATFLYLKALDCLGEKKDFNLLGGIYADMGYICSIQRGHREAIKKYRYSLACYNRTGNIKAACYRLIDIGRTYCNFKNHKTAERYFRYALKRTSDSMICGVIYQNIGINYYRREQYDSAQYYLRKSLQYPYQGNNYAIRNFNLADLLFDFEQVDSAYHYATTALKYPANFYLRRDCYRLLVNVEYLRKDIKQMGKYMTLYQAYTDSIQKLELQTKSTVLENVHNNVQQAKGTKHSMGVLISVLLIFLLLFIFVVSYLYRRNRVKKNQLELYKHQLNTKQEFVIQGLSKKIEEAKALLADERKNAMPAERIKLDKCLYNSVLHLNDWGAFKPEMNHAFNQIVDKMESDYSGITRREIIWCCLHLLEVPNADRLLLLDATSDSLYKLKQRLAQKMNLKSTKELDSFLIELTVIHN